MVITNNNMYLCWRLRGKRNENKFKKNSYDDEDYSMIEFKLFLVKIKIILLISKNKNAVPCIYDR